MGCFQLSVCLSVQTGGGPMWPLPMMNWTSLYRDPPPPYDRQAGGTYPTGMLSCAYLFLKFKNGSNFNQNGCRKETYSSRLGHCEDVNHSYSIIIYELSQHQTHNFHGHTSSSMLQHLQCNVNMFPNISVISLHKDFYIQTHSCRAKAKIFFDVCNLFFDLFVCSLIFFDFASAFVRCEKSLSSSGLFGYEFMARSHQNTSRHRSFTLS